LGRDSRRLTLLCPGYEAVIQGLPRTEKFPYPQSRLFVVDLAGPSLRATLDMGGWNNLYSDGAHFYLLDPGKPDKNPQKNRNGSVQIAALERGAVAGSVDAGREPRGLYQDETGGQVLIPSDGPPGSFEGELRVVRGDRLVGKAQQSGDRDVFVYLGPSDPEAGPDQLPVATLLGRRVAQPGKPL